MNAADSKASRLPRNGGIGQSLCLRAQPGAPTISPDAQFHKQFKAALNLCILKAHGNIQRLADEPKAAAWALNGDF